jgi:hypothetical protein
VNDRLHLLHPGSNIGWIVLVNHIKSSEQVAWDMLTVVKPNPYIDRNSVTVVDDNRSLMIILTPYKVLLVCTHFYFWNFSLLIY